MYEPFIGVKRKLRRKPRAGHAALDFWPVTVQLKYSRKAV